MPFLVFILALSVFAQGTSEFMLAGLLPEISASLDISLPTAALLTSTFAVGMIVGAPTMAAFSRRWSPRTALCLLLSVFVAMHVVGALTDQIGILLATRTLAAIANAGFLAVTLSLVTRVAPPGRQGRALAAILSGTTLALIVGVPAGAAIGAVLDWRAALWAIVLLCTPALVVLPFTAPREPHSETVSLRHELRSLHQRRLLCTLLLVALFNTATFCGYTYLAPVVTHVAGLPQDLVPVVLAAFGIGAFAGVTIAGRAADTHPQSLLFIAAAVTIAGWVTVGITASFGWALLPLALLVGAASFAVGSTTIALAVRNAPDAPTMGGSYSTAALNVGAMVGPIAGGTALSITAAPLSPIVISAAVGVLGLLALIATRPAVLQLRTDGTQHGAI